LKTGIILAGGEARRAGGSEKYLFSYNGETFLQRLISTLNESVDEIIIVVRDEKQCRKLGNISGVTIVTDIRKCTGPIGGLHAGIKASKGDIMFVVACDMPFVNKEVIKRLFEIADDYDAVIPCWNDEMFEPLHAVYKKNPLEDYMKSHKSLSMRDMIRNIRSCYVNVERLKDIDPELRTFTNINHLEELEKLKNGELFK